MAGTSLTKRSSKDIEYSSYELKNIVINKFSQLCTDLVNVIKEKRPVSSSNLDSFSKFTTVMLRRNLMPKTENFEHLSRMISDYWHYSLQSEDDAQRGCSYIQLYQMITMMQQNYKDYKIDYDIHIVAKKSSDEDLKLIERIKHTPGITFEELKNEKNVYNGDLPVRLNNLEKKQFISGRRDGKYRFYILTDLGDRLYQDIYSETNYIWGDQWDRNRIRLLVLLLQHLREKKNSFLIQDLIYFISSLPNKEVSILSDILLRQFKVRDNNNIIISIDIGSIFN